MTSMVQVSGLRNDASQVSRGLSARQLPVRHRPRHYCKGGDVATVEAYILIYRNYSFIDSALR